LIPLEITANRAQNRPFRVQWVSTAAANQLGQEDAEQNLSEKEEVRERASASVRPRQLEQELKGPSHRSKCLIAQLNASWRIVDDPLQWILQRRKGESANDP
jgi:hypothetical protein